jgi:hypothetical protein
MQRHHTGVLQWHWYGPSERTCWPCVRDDGIFFFLKGASHVSSPTVVFMHKEVKPMPIMHATEHLVPHLAHSSTVPFAYHNVCIWKSQLFCLRWALVIFGSGKKEHPSPRTLVGRTWRVKWVRVPNYTYIAHRIKMYILAFPGMCPVYGRYSGPKNRFEDSLNTVWIRLDQC